MSEIFTTAARRTAVVGKSVRVSVCVCICLSRHHDLAMSCLVVWQNFTPF